MKTKELDFGMGIICMVLITAFIYGLSILLTLDFQSLLLIFYGWFAFRYFIIPSKKPETGMIAISNNIPEMMNAIEDVKKKKTFSELVEEKLKANGNNS